MSWGGRRATTRSSPPELRAWSKDGGTCCHPTPAPLLAGATTTTTTPTWLPTETLVSATVTLTPGHGALLSQQPGAATHKGAPGCQQPTVNWVPVRTPLKGPQRPLHQPVHKVPDLMSEIMVPLFNLPPYPRLYRAQVPGTLPWLSPQGPPRLFQYSQSRRSPGRVPPQPPQSPSSRAESPVRFISARKDPDLGMTPSWHQRPNFPV